nr:hypothetical protein [Phycisphaeraceae bacterium]
MGRTTWAQAGAPTVDANGTHHDTWLVVGKINGKADGTADEVFLYSLDAVPGSEPLEGAAVASLTADLDQSTFDRITYHDG